MNKKYEFLRIKPTRSLSVSEARSPCCRAPAYDALPSKELVINGAMAGEGKSGIGRALNEAS